MTVLPRTLSLCATLKLWCVLSVSAWHRDSVTQGTLSVGVAFKLWFCQCPRCIVTVLPRTLFWCYTQIVFFCWCPRGIVTVLPTALCLSVLHSHCVFCQCPRCIVTVLPRTLCHSVLHSNCVFLSVSAWHRDSVIQGTLSFGVTLKLCFLFVSVPRCMVTVLPRTLGFSVLHSNCVFFVSVRVAS